MSVQQQNASRREPAYAMWVVLAGITAVSAVTIVAILHYKDATELVGALGPIMAVIGSLVGAYFGLRGSSLAQQNANAAEIERAAKTPPAVTLPTGGFSAPIASPEPAA